jgi:hypothetical protein
VYLTPRRSLHLIYCFLFWVLLALCPTQDASAQHQSADSVSAPSANALLADMARLIKEHAYNKGVSVAFRYDAYADTTRGRKLYVAQQITLLGDANPKEWYFIDFMQPMKAKDLKVLQGRNGFFEIDACRQITKKIKRRVSEGPPQEKGRNARLFISFLPDKKKREVDHTELQNQLSDLISQLINDVPIKER